jgi:hypothetical protein
MQQLEPTMADQQTPTPQQAVRQPYRPPKVQAFPLEAIVQGNNGRPFDCTLSGARNGPGGGCAS